MVARGRFTQLLGLDRLPGEHLNRLHVLFVAGRMFSYVLVWMSVPRRIGNIGAGGG